MTVKELISELKKMDGTKLVYFRDGRKCKSVTIVKDSEHANGLWIELTNQECDLKRSKR